MRTEAVVFTGSGVFFVVMAVIYGVLTNFDEWVGFPAILLTGGLSLMIGVYFFMLARRHGTRPEDREDAEIAELSGDQGLYAPWSWWPLALGASAAVGFVALAVGWWLMVPAAMMTVISLTGWVMEYSRGIHRH